MALGEPTSVSDLLDKQAIIEVIYRRARAADRREVALALSCYHDGAIEDHDGYVGPAEGFIQRAWLDDTPVEMTWHAISSVLVELRGDVAAAETYVVCAADVVKDGQRFDVTMGARYLDNFARIGGRWAITHRRQLYDFSRVEPAGVRFWEFLGQDQSKVLLGSPDGNDLSYAFFATDATP